MSFFTALLNYSGARNQARNAASQQAYENELQSRELGIEQQNANTQNELSQLQADQYRQALQQATANRQFESGLQLPKGWAQMQPDQRIAYLTNRYNAAQKAGDQDIAKSTLDEMNSLELGAERLANAQYTTQGRLPLAQAQAQEAKDRGYYYSHRLGVDLQKARMMLEAARGHDATRVQTAQIAATAAMQRAGLSAQTQMEGRILAGYFALQGRNAADATQMAIAAAKDANTYAEKTALLTGGTPPALVTPQQEMPNISLSVAPGGNDNSALMLLAPLVSALLKGQTPKGNGNGNGNPKADIKQQVSGEVQHIRQALQAKVPPAQIVRTLQMRVQKGEISREAQQEILREIFGVPAQ